MIVLVVLLAVGGFGFVGCIALVGTAVDEAGREREARERQIAGDVELTGCRAGQFGPEALIEITNRSSKRSNYMVKVIFVASEGTEQYGSGSAYVSGLAPGRTTTERVSSFGSDEVDSVECEVADVTRFSDE